MVFQIIAAGAIGGMVGSLLTLAVVATAIQTIIKKFQEWGLWKTAQYLVGMFKFFEKARTLPAGQLLAVEDAKMYRQYLAQANSEQYKQVLVTHEEYNLEVEARQIEVEMKQYLPQESCVVM
ncbi:hypothetical protein P154DRAFT_573315 [Amniculicola lignicola CBS 123094]|uniref:Uncharacterized protein n=1 Tax=Amniculicola lignicola CBS 123094 TaxID=1392246 RepID=A0A6A5WN79_9PLEO|nr:hypothetical protein P154DRAFT_573315 [Amniculicola lignicola CBS 123094]